MELRVWVDGTQRVVCGVKLTTTCQEIVFALAHATQQAGRFTMIERWRNNERLLSPNEQPLVTLQRWGDRMNEVEFILRKTSTDSQPPANRAPGNPTLNQQALPGPINSEELKRSNIDNNTTAKQQVLTNGHRESPANHLPSTSNHNQTDADNSSDTMLQQMRHYDMTRQSQNSLGQLSSSSSAVNLGASYMQANPNRLSNSFRPSLSASTLPNSNNNMAPPPVNPNSMLRPRLQKDLPLGSNSPSSSMNDPNNGYQLHNGSSQFVQNHHMPIQSRVAISTRNHPYEDLYSTINKKRINHLPPAVPAKPRLVCNPLPQQILQPNNNAQMNFYRPNSTTANIYPNNLRPRHPPGYLEYLDAMAHRNSLPPNLVSDPNYIHQNHHQTLGNLYNRQLDPRISLYGGPTNGSSPASSTASNQQFYQANRQFSRASLGLSQELNTSGQQSITPVNSKFVEPSGLVLNRGSAVNVRLTSNSQLHIPQNAPSLDDNLNLSSHSNTSSMSQMGLDMLKVIEEQKKVLMNQKNELDRLDNDKEYLDAKQSSEQAELINRIEKEIQQLEGLWKENQMQINKLENQDFERELEHLKSEQIRMEHELASQRNKLTKCENDITECKTKIEQLESELSEQGLESDTSMLDENVALTTNGREAVTEGKPNSKSDDLTLIKAEAQANNGSAYGTNEQKLNNMDLKSSDEEEEDDSSGDASDDLNTNSYESNKIRSTKEVAFVEKRGLISGIRSLKLDKSRALNKSIESLNSNESASLRNLQTNSPSSKEKAAAINNNLPESRCAELQNGPQLQEKSAQGTNYEFLMTL